MKLYKILECKNYSKINKQISNFVKTVGVDKSSNFWNPVNTQGIFESCPLFTEWLSENKIYIQTLSVTVGRNKFCCGPHIDTPPARYKLSWPILNCENTFNRWYKVINRKDYQINQLGGKIFDKDNLIEIECNEVLHPMIIDASVPHDVYIKKNNFPRLGLQCQLFNEPKSL